MNVTREMRVAGLEHEDMFVRSQMLSRLRNDGDRGLDVTRAVLAMIDRFGWMDAFERSSGISALAIDGASLDWALDRLQTRDASTTGERAETCLASWIVDAPVEVLAPRMVRLVATLGARSEASPDDRRWAGALAIARRRLANSEVAESECLARLEEIADECAQLDEWSYDLVGEAEMLCERLGIDIGGATTRATVPEWLVAITDDDWSSENWRGGFGVVIAGLLRLSETASSVIGWLRLDWDWMSENVGTALTRMNDLEVVRQVIDRFSNAAWSEKLHLVGVIENSRFPELEPRVRELLEAETDVMIRLFLAIALTAYGSDESLAMARDVFAEDPENIDYQEIIETDYAIAMLRGASGDEPEWFEIRTQMQKRLERIRAHEASDEFESADQSDGPWNDEFEELGRWEPNKPQIAPKLPGRNNACPCGSGKKYKKCCLEKV